MPRYHTIGLSQSLISYDSTYISYLWSSTLSLTFHHIVSVNVIHTRRLGLWISFPTWWRKAEQKNIQNYNLAVQVFYVDQNRWRQKTIFPHRLLISTFREFPAQLSRAQKFRRCALQSSLGRCLVELGKLSPTPTCVCCSAVQRRWWSRPPHINLTTDSDAQLFHTAAYSINDVPKLQL